MARAPRPGMGQDEKDKLGAAQHAERQEEALLDRLATETDRWLPDDRLEAEDVDLDALRAEAERRGLQLPKTISRDDLVKRLRERRRQVDRRVETRGQERPYKALKPWEPSP